MIDRLLSKVFLLEGEPPSDETLPRTLSGYLTRADRRSVTSAGRHVALRYKRLGIWQQQRWPDIYAEVNKLAQAFSEQGVKVGSKVFWTGGMSARLVTAILAVHQLGATVLYVDKEIDSSSLTQLIRQQHIRVAITDDPADLPGLSDLLDNDGALSFVWHDDLSQVREGQPGWLNLADIEAQESGHAVKAIEGNTALDAGEAVAFESIRRKNGRVVSTLMTHQALIAEARQVQATQNLTRDDSLLLDPTMDVETFFVYAYGVWLVTGLLFHIPETLNTVNKDRREIGPTYFVGDDSQYAALREWVVDRLPEPGSWRRRWVDWSFSTYAAVNVEGVARRERPVLVEWWNSAVAWLTVVRPLQHVLGTSRVRSAVACKSTQDPLDGLFLTVVGLLPQRWHAVGEIRAVAGAGLGYEQEAEPVLVTLTDRLGVYGREELQNVVRA